MPFLLLVAAQCCPVRAAAGGAPCPYPLSGSCQAHQFFPLLDANCDEVLTAPEFRNGVAHFG